MNDGSACGKGVEFEAEAAEIGRKQGEKFMVKLRSFPSISVTAGLVLIVLGIGYYQWKHRPFVVKVTRTMPGHVLTFTPSAGRAAIQDDETKLVWSIFTMVDPKTNKAGVKLDPNMKAGDSGTILYENNGAVEFKPDPK
jgi:hypothetical protein